MQHICGQTYLHICLLFLVNQVRQALDHLLKPHGDAELRKSKSTECAFGLLRGVHCAIFLRPLWLVLILADCHARQRDTGSRETKDSEPIHCSVALVTVKWAPEGSVISGCVWLCWQAWKVSSKFGEEGRHYVGLVAFKLHLSSGPRINPPCFRWCLTTNYASKIQIRNKLKTVYTMEN